MNSLQNHPHLTSHRSPGEKHRIWTISNFLSFSRVLFLFPILYFLHQGTDSGKLLALLFIAMAALTDWSDGFLARKFHQKSDIGRIIDPVSDKICIGGIAIYTTVYYGFPLWFLVLIIARDLSIMLFGLLMTSRNHQVPESNWYGKIAVTAMAIVLLTFIVDAHTIKWPLFWIMVVLFFISATVYAARFISDRSRT